MKRCTKCGQPKPLIEFRIVRCRLKNRTYAYRRGWCRLCENQIRRPINARSAKKRRQGCNPATTG